MDILELQKLEEEIDARMQRIYDGAAQRWVPRYPWVLVRVLKRAHQLPSGIWLPDRQNKTVHEGIVLRTWNAFKNKKNAEKKSLLAPGQHVVFSHYAGLPLQGMNEERYRIVREEEWGVESGGIMAELDYEGREQRAGEKLKKLLFADGAREGDYDIDRVVPLIEQQFLLVDRDGEAVTISGR